MICSNLLACGADFERGDDALGVTDFVNCYVQSRRTLSAGLKFIPVTASYFARFYIR
jgi:hypothetical protein